MDQEIQLSIENAMSQAEATAEHYFMNGKAFLSDEDWERDSDLIKASVELAKVKAMDFHTAVICMKLQEIRDAIEKCRCTTT